MFQLRLGAYFCNSHSRLSRGQTFRVLSQREIQWKWNACYTCVEDKACVIHSQNNDVHARYKYPKRHYTLRLWRRLDWPGSRCLTANMSQHAFSGTNENLHKSMIWFLQMAQLSTTISAMARDQSEGMYKHEGQEHTPRPQSYSIPLHITQRRHKRRTN